MNNTKPCKKVDAISTSGPGTDWIQVIDAKEMRSHSLGDCPTHEPSKLIEKSKVNINRPSPN